MAYKTLASAISILIISNIITSSCEDQIRPQKYGMRYADESLLRSSGERNEALEEEIPEEIEDHPNETTDDYPPPKTEFDSSTDNPTTSKLSDVTRPVKDDEEEAKKEDQANRRIDDNVDVTSTTVAPDETTTDSIDEIDSADVYKLDEDTGNLDANISESTVTITKVEPTTSTASPALQDEPVVPRVSRFDDDQTYGLRSPKNDNSEAVMPPDTRTFDAKPSEPHISKSDILKEWLEDSWLRSPPGILVPLRPEVLSRALAVWKDLTSEDGLKIADVVVIGYDSNGINWRSRHNLQGNNPNSDKRAVTEVLSKLLRKYQDVSTMSGDGTMRALTSGAKLVPYDSALFVITDKGAADAQRLPLALRALVEKRLKVYTIWTDPEFPSSESETALQELRNISAHTEGDVLAYSLQTMVMDSDVNSDAETDALSLPQSSSRMAKLNALVDEKLEILLVKRGGGGAISLGVPVETGVSGLRVYIEGAVEHAVLYPPNDAPQIDLYNLTSVELFSPGSKTNTLSPRDVYLTFPGATDVNDMLSVLPMTSAHSDNSAQNAGVWHLSMRCATCDYRLTISARAPLRFKATVLPKNMLRLRVNGPVSTVRESLLVDEYGRELAKLTFSYQPAAGEGSDDPRQGDQDQELVAEVPLPDVKSSKVYAKIVGRDVHGESFSRFSGPLSQISEPRTGRSASIVFPTSELELAEEYQPMRDNRVLYNDSNVLPNNRAASQVINQLGTLMTAVQVGLSSKIYGAPGDDLQLHFEVTNYREQGVYFRFEAVGELRFLKGISPNAQTIGSGQTAVVIVTLRITPGSQPGARDLITFSAYGNSVDQVSISTYVYVMNRDAPVTDTWAPTVQHQFQGSCIGRRGDDCARHIWSATVFAKDSVGGLLRLSSTPVGLMLASNFISGTREEVVATYRATCCAPRVMINAVDTYGNANSYLVDISDYYTPAAISAIVLGVFFIIALIAVIVFLIYWCVRRRKESRELPYTASSRRDIS